jgi:uncharacterized membrane protein
MEVIGRVMGVLAAMTAGAATALLVLPLLIVFDPLSNGAGLIASLSGFIDILDNTLEDMPANEVVSLFAGFIWLAALMICVLPVVLVALIGEIASVRSLIWYSGATGVVAASMPWFLRVIYQLDDAISAKPIELRFALLFFLTGTTAGFIYWSICGRRAGLRSVTASRSLSL